MWMKLLPQQTGFRPRKSCTGQILNLTPIIEKGFEARKITDTVFIDLTNAYDTINPRIITYKLYKITRDLRSVKLIEDLLTNRKFFFNHNEKKNRWKNFKNGLLQGSVLAPTMFNVNTYDQPSSKNY